MPSMNLSFPFLTLCCFLHCFLGCISVVGSWPFLSDLFSWRSSATVASRSQLYQMDLSNYVKLCKPRMPDWQKHPIGLVGHLIFTRAVQKLAKDITRYQENQLDTITKQQVATDHYYESFAKDQLLRHFLEMTTLELNACDYIAKHLSILLEQARNLTVDSNNTVVLGSERPPVWKDYKAFLLYYRASIFSSVCSSCTLFVVLLRRTRLGIAFIFLFKLVIPNKSRSISQSSSQSFTTLSPLAIGPTRLKIKGPRGAKTFKSN